MASSELIKPYRCLYLWGNQPPTDISGFDARRVGLSHETAVVRLGGTRDSPGPCQRDDLQGALKPYHFPRLPDCLPSGNHLAGQRRIKPPAAMCLKQSMQNLCRCRHQTGYGVRGLWRPENCLGRRSEHTHKMSVRFWCGSWRK